MSYVSNQEPRTTPTPIDIQETAGGGPLTTQQGNKTYSYTPRRVSARARVEKVGYWIVVAAAFALLLFLAGVFLPKIIGGTIAGFYIGAFVGALTLMNLPRPSHWGNSLLGRKVFPVLHAPDGEIIKLAAVNSFFAFAFAFVFQVVASLVGSFLLSGLIVFGLLAGAAVFYNRVRSVVIKP